MESENRRSRFAAYLLHQEFKEEFDNRPFNPRLLSICRTTLEELEALKEYGTPEASPDVRAAITATRIRGMAWLDRTLRELDKLEMEKV